jgi:hypothetical protein
MLPTILRAGEVGLLALVGYNAITAIPGWRTPTRAPRSPGHQRFRVVIAAHDEAGVIGTLLDDLARLDYDAAFLTVWVIADRCTDDTATIARARGARVDERRTGPDGKGAVLREHLETNPLAEDEALVVIDADNRVPTDLLARFADELAAGGHALQAYLDVANPGASPLATAGALSYWAGNRMVQLARTRLGWPADLGGTGMCLTGEALERSGGFGDSLTEDADLGARLARVGIPVRWVHDVRIGDEKPTTVGVVIRQRARWTAGRRGVARRHALPLLGAALRRGDGGLADLALRLVQPGRTFVALVSGILAVLAATVATEVLLHPGIWAAAAAMQFFMPLAFLAREGVAPRYLLAYPLLLLLAALWVPVRIASRLTRGWYHTPHQGG